MNTVFTSAEVLDFAAAVRAGLDDLTAEEREELAGGLEADLSDLVAERGSAELGDPDAYARELRTAAGLPPERVAAARARPGVGQFLVELLDRGGEAWETLVADLPGDPWEFVVTLRPVWWVLRAWLACQIIDLFVGDGGYNMSWLPSLLGLGPLVLLVAVVMSVQIGRQRLWPTRRTSVGRLVLLALNLFAVAMVPAVVASLPWDGRSDYYADDFGSEILEGLVNDGELVTNVYPYDAQGEPLVGVQLFDQAGQPLDVVESGSVDFPNPQLTYPWTNVNGEVWNVFPMAQAPARQADDFDRMESPWTSPTPPTLGRPPLDSVPSVYTPAVTPSVAEIMEGKRAEESIPAKPGRREIRRAK